MNNRQMKLEVLLAAVDKATAPIKRVLDSSKGLSKQLKDTKDVLRGLEKQQGTIDRLRQLQEQSKAYGAELHKVKGNLADYQAKLENTRTAKDAMLAKTKLATKEYMAEAKAVRALANPTAAQVAKLARMKDELEKLEREKARAINAHRRSEDAIRTETKRIDENAEKRKVLAERIRQCRTQLTEAGIKTHQLASHEGQIKTAVEATTNALRQQGSALERLNKIQSKRIGARAQYQKGLAAREQLAGAGAGMMAAGAATGAALALPVSAYAQAEDAGMQLKVSMMDSAGKVRAEFAAINALAERLGNKLPGTTAELQDMMTMLNRQGMSAKAVLGGVGEASAYLGVQLKLPYTQAAEYAAKMQDATGALESDMMGVMDTIQRTYQVGVDPSNMVTGFAKLAPVLDMIKMKGLAGANAMAPLLAMADQASLTGESAGNAYRKVFQRSMDEKKVKKGNKLAKSAGVKLDFSNGKGEFGGLDQMFNQLAQLKKLSTQKRNAVIAEIWGDDAETLQALNVMIDKGQSGYREMQQKMAEQASLQQRVNAQLGTLKNLWDAASGTFTNAMVRFGEAIAPELKILTEWIGNISERLGTWASANPALANTMMKVAAAAAIVLSALGGLSLALAAFMGPMLITRLGLKMMGISLGSLLPEAAGFRKALDGIAPALGKVSTGAGAAAATVRTALASAWRGADPRKVAADTLAYATTLKERIPAASKAAMLATTQWGRDMGGRLQSSIRTAQGAAAQYTAQLWQTVKAQLAVNRAAAAGKWQGVKSYVATKGMGGMGKDALQGGWDMAKGGAISTVKGMGGALMGLGRIIMVVGRLAMMNPIGLALAASAFLVIRYWEPIKAFFGGFWQGLTTGIAPLSGAFSAAFSSIGTALAPLKPVWDWLIAAMGSAWGWISKLFTPINATKQSLDAASASGQGFGTWLASIVMIAAKVLAAFIDLPIKFVSLGVNVMQGLVTGITTGLGSVKAAITGAGEQTIAWFKEKLGIHSPSRVFAELGGFTMAGLHQGIASSQDGPLGAVISVAKKLTAAGAGITLGMAGTTAAVASVPIDTRPPVAASRPAVQVAAPDSVVFHIYQAPGQSPQELTRMIEQMMDARDRKKAAAGRSRFTDKD